MDKTNQLFSGMQASATRIEMKMIEECDEKLKQRVEDYIGENRGCTLIYNDPCHFIWYQISPLEFHFLHKGL